MSDSWKEEAKNILAVKKLAEEGDEEAKQLVWLRRQLTTLEAEATTKAKEKAKVTKTLPLKPKTKAKAGPTRRV